MIAKFRYHPDISVIPIETERLLLRKWSLKDKKDMFEYSHDPDVGPNAGWKPHNSIKDTANYIASRLLPNSAWAIVVKSNNKVVGSVGLNPDDRRPLLLHCKMLGYSLSKAYWGQGLMTEACYAIISYIFSNTSTKIITAYHYPFNTRSKRVIDKLGFKNDIYLKQVSQRYDGVVFDELGYSLNKKDWLNQ